MAVLNIILFTAALALRPDVSKNLGALACQDETDNRPLGAWKAGVFDAQIDGRRTETRAGRTPSMEELERRAHSLARSHGYLGYAAGQCPDGSGWSVATPSPAPLAIDRGGKVALPKALEEACETYRVDFAAALGGETKSLGSPRVVDTAALGDGVLSVTCQPPKPRFQGPVLWYLVPVGKGPADAPPAAGSLAESGKKITEQLMGWINAVRRGETLKPLVFKKEMNEEASVLAIEPSVAHNRAMLRKVGDSMEANSVRLIGEDRVKGRSAEAMAWLLWNSPRHRELILDKKATVAGITQKDTRGEVLAVLVVGEDEPMKTAKAGRGKRKTAKD